MSSSAHIFVYGTLKRGEERETCWPRRPLSIEWATTRGQLRDLGSYPALVEGSDAVLGELWQIAADDLAITLETLDEIEGYAQTDDDLYTRRVVECRTLANEPRAALTYFFRDPSRIATTPIVLPDQDGFCQWRRRG